MPAFQPFAKPSPPLTAHTADSMLIRAEALQHETSTTATLAAPSSSLPSLSTMRTGLPGTGITASSRAAGIAVGVACAVMAVMLLAAAYVLTRHLQSGRGGGSDNNLRLRNRRHQHCQHYLHRRQKHHQHHQRKHHNHNHCKQQQRTVPGALEVATRWTPWRAPKQENKSVEEL